MQEKEAEIAIFDKSGKVVSSKSRKDVNKENDLLGTVNILLTNKKEEIFTILAHDSIWEGKIGGSCAGLIRINETPIEASNRTLERELGIKVSLKQVHSGYHDFEGVKRWFYVFHGETEEVNPNNKDIIESKWITKKEVNNLIFQNKVMPTFKIAYENLK